MVRYQTGKWGNSRDTLFVDIYSDEQYLLEQNGFEQTYDDATGELTISNKITKEKLMVIAENAIVLNCSLAGNRYDSYSAHMIQHYCRSVLGINVLFIKRFKKQRLYVYPERQGWTNWDNDPEVKKYLIDVTKTVVIIDLIGNVLYGAEPQKTTSNHRRNTDEKGQSIHRRERETEW